MEAKVKAVCLGARSLLPHFGMICLALLCPALPAPWQILIDRTRRGHCSMNYQTVVCRCLRSCLDRSRHVLVFGHPGCPCCSCALYSGSRPAHSDPQRDLRSDSARGLCDMMALRGSLGPENRGKLGFLLMQLATRDHLCLRTCGPGVGPSCKGACLCDSRSITSICSSFEHRRFQCSTREDCNSLASPPGCGCTFYHRRPGSHGSGSGNLPGWRSVQSRHLPRSL